MRNFFRSLAAAAVVSLIAAAPAKAAVQIYDLGVVALGSNTTYEGVAGPGDFIEYIKFQLGFDGNASISYSSTSAQASGAINNGILDLFSCSTNCTGVALPAPTGGLLDSANLFNLTSTVQVAGLGPLFLNDGSYYLRLTGSVNPSLAYTGTISVASAVPEPSTWAMMLIGFAGLAFASSQRRKITALTA